MKRFPYLSFSLSNETISTGEKHDQIYFSRFLVSFHLHETHILLEQRITYFVLEFCIMAIPTWVPTLPTTLHPTSSPIRRLSPSYSPIYKVHKTFTIVGNTHTAPLRTRDHTVYDAFELHCGTLDVIGSAIGEADDEEGKTVHVKDAAGTIVAVVDSTGAVVSAGEEDLGFRGGGSELLGKVDGYTHEDTRALALLLVLVDPGMLGMRAARGGVK